MRRSRPPDDDVVDGFTNTTKQQATKPMENTDSIEVHRGEVNGWCKLCLLQTSTLISHISPTFSSLLLLFLGTNLINFTESFEEEGLFGLTLGIANATVSQTVAFASAAVSTGASVLMRDNHHHHHHNCNNFHNEQQLITPKDESRHNNQIEKEQSHPGILQFAHHITDMMLSAISPVLSVDVVFGRKTQCHHIDRNGKPIIHMNNQQHRMKKSDTDTTCSLSERFYDADSCCDRSEYYDATSYDLGASSLYQDCKEDTVNDPTFWAGKDIPRQIIVEKQAVSPNCYYLDVSEMISELLPFEDFPLERDEEGNAFFEIEDLNTIGDDACLRTMLDIMVECALGLAKDDDGSREITWLPESDTKKSIERLGCEGGRLLDDVILKYTASMRGGLQMLKTRGIVDMMAVDLRDLLLDCKRVTEFNKNSRGKRDLCTFQHGSIGDTRVVENEMCVPVVGRLVTLALTHSRPLDNDAGFVIVSRSVKRSLNEQIHSFYSVSILKAIGYQTELTNIAQMEASLPIPKFLMHRVALKGATDFFENVRSLRPN